MSSIPQDLLYTKDHEYVKKTADATVVLVGANVPAQGVTVTVSGVPATVPVGAFWVCLPNRQLRVQRNQGGV